MAGAIAQPRNELVDVADILGKVAPLFTSTNKTTTESSQSTIDPRVLAEGDALLQQLLERGNSTTQADNVVQDILHRAQLAFAPVLGEERAAGGYNSTTRQLLGNEAVARATAAASSAVLDSQNHALQQATALVNQRTAATRSTTGTSNTKIPAPINPMSLIAPLAGGFIKNKLFPDEKKKPSIPTRNPRTTPEDEEYLDERFSTQSGSEAVSGEATTYGVEEVSPIEGFELGPETITETGAYDVNSLSSMFSGESFLDIGTDPELLGEGAQFLETSAAEFGADAATDVGSDLLTEAGGEFAGELGGEFAAEAGLDAGLGIPILGLTNLIAGGASEGFLGIFGTFICTELHRQGKMSMQKKAKIHAKFHRIHSPATIAGYQWWSEKFVNLMRRSELATKVGAAIVESWYKQVTGRRSALGFAVLYGIIPASYCIGLLLNLKEMLHGASLRRN